MKRLAIYGAGGHGRVVCESAVRTGLYEIIGFIDDSVLPATEIDGHKVIGDLSALQDRNGKGIVIAIGIGSIGIRRRTVQQITDSGYEIEAVVDPTATVSMTARVGAGAYIAAGATINSQASLGTATIVNTGAIIEHDCRIGDFAEVAPRAVLGGQVFVGSGAFVGMGAVVRQQQQVGSGSVLGAGAVLVSDLPDNALAYGVPARLIEKADNGD